MSESSRESAFVYYNLARLCEKKEVIHGWLRERGLVGDFSEQCGNYGQGDLHLRQDRSLGDDCIWRCTREACGFKVSILVF